MEHHEVGENSISCRVSGSSGALAAIPVFPSMQSMFSVEDDMRMIYGKIVGGRQSWAEA